MSWDATESFSLLVAPFSTRRKVGGLNRLENYKGEKTQFELSMGDSIIILGREC